MNFLIRVRTGKLRGKEAEVTRHKGGNFSVVVHEALAPMQKAVAFFHEALHVLLWVFLPFTDEAREHKFIAAMERDLKKNLKKYWEGR